VSSKKYLRKPLKGGGAMALRKKSNVSWKVS
jgi:hypothetical protein